MVKIKSVKGRQVFDSRGNPTVEAEIFLDDGSSATAISPSGASTGAFEAHELRDKEQNKFLGKSVNIAVENINNKISNKLKGLESDDQTNIDKVLFEASSIGIDQGRLDDMPIKHAVYLNLSRDHLDYHRNYESYLQAKRRLIENEELETLVFNADQPEFIDSLSNSNAKDVFQILPKTSPVETVLPSRAL